MTLKSLSVIVKQSYELELVQYNVNNSGRTESICWG